MTQLELDLFALLLTEMIAHLRAALALRQAPTAHGATRQLRRFLVRVKSGAAEIPLAMKRRLEKLPWWRFFGARRPPVARFKLARQGRVRRAQKRASNLRFAALARAVGGNCLVLDDLVDGELHTTAVLQASGIAANRIYLASPHLPVVRAALRKYQLRHVTQGLVQAMPKAFPWSYYGAVWLDSMHSDPAKILALLTPLLPRLRSPTGPVVVATTMTYRSPAGTPFAARRAALEAGFAAAGFQVLERQALRLVETCFFERPGA